MKLAHVSLPLFQRQLAGGLWGMTFGSAPFFETAAWWSRGMNLLAPVPLSRHIFPTHTPLPPPILVFHSSYLSPSSASFFRCSSGLRRYPCLSDCLSLSFPLQPLPPSFSLSFARYVRVCRWLLLAGSVTRGKTGEEFTSVEQMGTNWSIFTAVLETPLELQRDGCSNQGQRLMQQDTLGTLAWHEKPVLLLRAHGLTSFHRWFTLCGAVLASCRCLSQGCNS